MPIGLQHPAIGVSSAQPTLFQRRVRFHMDARRAQRGDQVQQQVTASHGFSLAQEHGAHSSINTQPVKTA